MYLKKETRATITWGIITLFFTTFFGLLLLGMGADILKDVRSNWDQESICETSTKGTP